MKIVDTPPSMLLVATSESILAGAALRSNRLNFKNNGDITKLRMINDNDLPNT